MYSCIARLVYPSQVGTIIGLVDVISVLVVVSQATSDKLFATVRDTRLLGELHLPGVQDGLIAHNRHLRLVVSERLHPKQ